MEYLKKYWHIIAGVVCVAVLGGFYIFGNNSGVNATTQRRLLTSEEQVYAAGPEGTAVDGTALDETALGGTALDGIALDGTAPGGTAPEITTPYNPGITSYPPPEGPVPPKIIVHVEGAVIEPGVFSLPYGSRVNDALVKAGGPTEEADLARINLAAFLQDAQQIIIPTVNDEIIYIESAGGGTGSSPSGITDAGLININTATEAELRTLPGIGQVISGNIITHRETNGPFTTVEELRNVPRIGAITMDNIRALITVE